MDAGIDGVCVRADLIHKNKIFLISRSNKAREYEKGSDLLKCVRLPNIFKGAFVRKDSERGRFG